MMNRVSAHYEELLADVYSWMAGGFESSLERYGAYFSEKGVAPRRSGQAVDLGAGCGFQSIPLARCGFTVTAIDISAKLLDELNGHGGDLPIRTIEDDMMNFDRHVPAGAELVVCMTDTLLHLDSREQVIELFRKVYAALEDGGVFIVTFRDLSKALEHTERFIAVRSDENRVFTCFLEYQADKVTVFDLLHQRSADGWSMSTSYYRKLRLSSGWVRDQLLAAGFLLQEASVAGGVVTAVAVRGGGSVGDGRERG